MQTALNATTLPAVGCDTTIGVDPSFADTAPPTGMDDSGIVTGSEPEPPPDPPEPSAVHAVRNSAPPTAVALPIETRVRRVSGVASFIRGSSRSA